MPEERSRPAGNRFVPNVPVIAHDGTRAMFYDDLIKDKVVLVGFMSIANDASYPVTRNLVQVQRLLGDRLGREAHVFSITVDPGNDTVSALRAFAKKYEVRPGWSFLTGEEPALEAIRGAFFAHRDPHPAHLHGHGVHGEAAVELHDCSMGLMRYGNDAVGLWGSVAAKADPAQIVDRLSWIQARPPHAAGTPLRRGGPFPFHWLPNSPHPPSVRAARSPYGDISMVARRIVTVLSAATGLARVAWAQNPNEFAYTSLTAPQQATVRAFARVPEDVPKPTGIVRLHTGEIDHRNPTERYLDLNHPGVQPRPETSRYKRYLGVPNVAQLPLHGRPAVEDPKNKFLTLPEITVPPNIPITYYITPEGIYPKRDPFSHPPGTNFLPTVYQDVRDGFGLTRWRIRSRRPGPSRTICTTEIVHRPVPIDSTLADGRPRSHLRQGLSDAHGDLGQAALGEPRWKNV